MQKTAIYILFFITLSVQCMNMSVYNNKIYLLDEFNRKLNIFNDDGSTDRTVCLKNISRSGYFDFFIKKDRFNSLIHDYLNGSIHLLDDKFEVRKTVPLRDLHKIDIIPKLFPVGSNSIIFSTSDKLSIYILRNDQIRVILLSDIPYTDFFSDGKKLFLLFDDHISLYTISGVFIKNIPLPMSENSYSSLYVTSSHIFLHNIKGIAYLKKDLSESGFLEDLSILSYAGIGNTLFYSSSNTSGLEFWRAEN